MLILSYTKEQRYPEINIQLFCNQVNETPCWTLDNYSKNFTDDSSVDIDSFVSFEASNWAISCDYELFKQAFMMNC